MLEPRTLLAADLVLVQTGLTGGFFTHLQNELNQAMLPAPVPLLSDLGAKQPNGQPVTALSLARAAASQAGNNVAARAVSVAETVIRLTGAILDFDLTAKEDSTAVTPLGSFVATATRPLGGGGAPPPSAGGKAEIKQQQPNTEAQQHAQQHGPQKTKDFLANFGTNFRFPLLQDTSNVFRLLVGETTPELFTLALDLGIGFEFAYSYPVFPGLLNADLGLALNASLDLDFGYDALGVARFTDALDFSSEQALEVSMDEAGKLLAHGFFFDDDDPHLVDDDGAPEHVKLRDSEGNQPAESEAPEVALSATLSDGSSFGPDLVVLTFKAGRSASFTTNIFFDLNDLPNPLPGSDPLNPSYPGPDEFEYDGRVRFNEMALAFEADPFGIFNSSGELVVGLQAFVKATLGKGDLSVTLIDKKFKLVEEVIFDFNIFSLSDEEILSGVKVNAPVLGAVNNGVLDLYMGPDAGSREHTNADRSGPDSVTDEAFYIRSLGASQAGGETIEVTFRGEEIVGEQPKEINHRQVFEGVTRITGEGAEGEDIIVVDSSVAANVVFDGGAGKDIISYGGTGTAILTGGDDDDVLIGGQGFDIIGGGPGNDELFGRGGNDQLFGNDGEDLLVGGNGVDNLTGGAHGDQYLGDVGTGNDLFSEAGGSQEDRILIGGQTTVLVAGESVGFTEADDVISIDPLGSDGVVQVVTSAGTIELDNIELISVAAGGGSDTVAVSNLAGTDVTLMAFDLSPAGDGTDGGVGDTVIYEGSATGDSIMVKAVEGTVEDNSTSDPDSGGSTDKAVVQITDSTGVVETNVFVLNSSPEADTLKVCGFGDDDALTVAAGEAGLRSQDLIAVQLDGGDGFDTLIYDNFAETDDLGAAVAVPRRVVDPAGHGAQPAGHRELRYRGRPGGTEQRDRRRHADRARSGPARRDPLGRRP